MIQKSGEKIHLDLESGSGASIVYHKDKKR